MRRLTFPAATATPHSSPYPLAEAPTPTPAAGQVLVRIEAAGIGIALLRTLVPGNPGAHDPGGEIVGRVAAVGGGTPFKPGDRVGGVVFSGAYAEYALAAPPLLSPVPEDVTAEDALALVRGGLIALSTLRAARFEKGESVLVTGAASGVGHLQVQLAKAFGAGRVIGAVGSTAKADFVRRCGADDVVTYAEDEWREMVDVVFDGVGGALVEQGVTTLRPHGRLVAYSGGGGLVDVGGLLGDLKTVTGFSIGRIARERPDLVAERREELWTLLRDGVLRPACTALPWERFGDALDLIRRRANEGRVLVRIG